MPLGIHWAEQALSEVTCTVQADDTRIFAATVMDLLDLIYALEKQYGFEDETDSNNQTTVQYALEALPQKWHVVVLEASRIEHRELSRRACSEKSLFESREQRRKAASEFAAYIIELLNKQYRLFH